MRHFKLLVVLILIFSCKTENEKGFTFKVKVNGDYSDYLYLNYDNKRDSSFITNGYAFFKGYVRNPTMANFSTNYISASDKNFYLENVPIQSEITLSMRQMKEYNIDWITIDKFYGTQTAILRDEFDKYQLDHKSDNDWQNKLFIKLKEIIQENPKHKFSGDLLSEMSNDTILTIKQIGELYSLLDHKSQNPVTINNLKFKAFPKLAIKSGDLIYDFDLPSEKENSIISTKDFRGKILFIDFWASWCKPCRVQFPDLKEINDNFKDKNVVILGVSLDEKRADWLEALKEEEPKWQNVIDTIGFSGDVALAYSIQAIPYNLLVDIDGKVISQDINLKELRKSLDSLTRK